MSTVPISSSNQGESFSASRWTRGNFIFRTRIVVSPLHVSRVKPRFFSKTEESIAISQVASVQITTGILETEIRINSTVGVHATPTNGHRKRDDIRTPELNKTNQTR